MYMPHSVRKPPADVDEPRHLLSTALWCRNCQKMAHGMRRPDQLISASCASVAPRHHTCSLPTLARCCRMKICAYSTEEWEESRQARHAAQKKKPMKWLQDEADEEEDISRSCLCLQELALLSFCPCALLVLLLQSIPLGPHRLRELLVHLNESLIQVDPIRVQRGKLVLDRRFLTMRPFETKPRCCSRISQSDKATIPGLNPPHRFPASSCVPTRSVCERARANRPSFPCAPPRGCMYLCVASAPCIHTDRTSSSKKLPSFRADAAADAARAVAASASDDASLATLCAAAAAATASLAASSAASSPPLSSPPSDDTARCADRDLAELRKQDRWPRERTKHCRGAGPG